MIEYKETRHTLQQKQISDLSLYSAGYEACAPGHHYGPIYRAYQLIHFILSGKGVLEIDGHTFQLGAGDAFLIPPAKSPTMPPTPPILGAIPGSIFWASIPRCTPTN